MRHPPAPPVSWVSPLSLSAAKQLQSQDPNSRGKRSLLHSELQASPSQPEPARASQGLPVQLRGWLIPTE